MGLGNAYSFGIELGEIGIFKISLYTYFGDESQRSWSPSLNLQIYPANHKTETVKHPFICVLALTDWFYCLKLI